MRRQHITRTVELLLLYAVLPVLLTLIRDTAGDLIIPILLLVGAVMLIMLFRSPEFDRDRLWKRRPDRHALGRIFLRWLGGGLVLTLAVFVFTPENLFRFPRERLDMWIVVMLAYPLLSVYPQEIIFRAYFFHRYRGLFPTRTTMILASGAGFALGHLLFLNWIALLLSFAGGLLFAYTYTRTDSIPAVALEHGLWGNTIFTIGLGLYFYGGAIN